MYAQQKGFPFWPAKVMRILPSSTGSDKDCQYDVRFFGGYHQRALVEKQCIRPITVNIHSLKVWQKKTQYYYVFLNPTDLKNSWNHLHEIFRKMENIPIS